MRFGKEFGLGVLVLTLASGVCSAASTAAVSGVVRDTQGIAQMGALVQVLAANSASVATALTDADGKYRIANLVPGKYQVRATAALYVPAIRRNLQLSTGMRATVNLTLNMLSDPAVWLPAKPRMPGEPNDDWNWTLRSSVNRPILRILDDGSVMVANGGKPGTAKVTTEARGSLVGGDGGFGKGRSHTSFALNRTSQDGTTLVVRAGIAAADREGRQLPTEIDAGYQKQGMFGNASRMIVGYVSHPEMLTSGGASGLQALRLSSAEKMHLGDLADVEAGGTVYAIRMAGAELTSRPFVKVTVHPGQVWAVQYKLATARDLQEFNSLNSVSADTPVSAVIRGRVETESGRHQEIGVSRKIAGGEIRAAVYHDAVERSAIAGTGILDVADALPSNGLDGLVIDTGTQTFRVLGNGYSTEGLSIGIVEPINGNLLAALEYASGAAMVSDETGGKSLSEVLTKLHAENARSVTATLNGNVRRTGTAVHVSYRWQPHRLATAVDPYDAGDEAYLGFYLRQEVRWGDILPPGLEATLDVTNLLAEGYRPFLSADGRTLYLAQSPRTVRGGLSFRF